MKNRWMVLYFLITCTITNIAWSKGHHDVIFESMCQRLEQENDYCEIKRRLPETEIAIDPIDGTSEIFYKGDRKLIEHLKRNSKETQLGILRTTCHSIYPLQDTIYLIDTTNFFQEGATNKLKGHVFRVVRGLSSRAERNYLYLSKVGTIKDQLILCVMYPNESFLTNYYFILLSENLKFLKSSIVDLPQSQIQFDRAPPKK